MLISDLQNKKIVVWGTGSEGQAALAYLKKHAVSPFVETYNDSEGEQGLHKVWNSQVIIRSPGVSIYKEEIRQAQAEGIKITSSSDLFLNEMRTRHPQTKVIGISGSKGKSTSVSMLYHMLNALGCRAALGGNIGKPLIELIDESYDYVVGEFSSYQASDLTASPQIVMFTNLFSVHTDWHGGHENYCRDKVHLAANQQPGDVCIVNRNNAQLLEYCKNLPNIVYYGGEDEFYASGKELFYQKEKLLNIDELKLSGNHNMENLAGVMTILQILGLDFRKAAASLKTFEPLPHRLQKIDMINNVLFINDSISTAPEAAISAMRSFDNNIVIISGGIENKQDYTDYARFVQDNPKVRAAVTLFQCGPQIADSLKKYVSRKDFQLIEAQSLEEGVAAAYGVLASLGGGLVLFSPTAPSFGYYKNFMERGEHFIKIVKTLAK